MGAIRGKFTVKRSPALLGGLLIALVVLALGAGTAQAATVCTDNWTGTLDSDWFTAGNWDNGVPTSSSNVCINNSTSATVVISGLVPAQANSLELGVGSTGGVQKLEIQGTDNGTPQLAELDLHNGGTIGSTGDLELTGNCTSGACNKGAPAALTNLGSASVLVNQGTIESDAGNDTTPNYAVNSNVINQGAILANASLTWAGGSIESTGTVSIANGQVMTLGCCGNTASLTNNNNGVVTNNGGTGYLAVASGGTFNSGAGTTHPSSVNPAHPAVILDNIAFENPPPALVYSGTGASAVEARGTASLSGNLASDQSLNINGVSGCPSQTLVTAASGFTNAGAITLGGTCDSGLHVSGTLNNTGTLTAASTGSGITREIMGSLTNSGTLTIDGATSFDGFGATLEQTAGSTTVASSTDFDTSPSGSTFQLQGGTLSGGGQSQAAEAVVTGPVNNSGGDIIPGSATKPGLLAVGGYTQGSGGKLTATVDGGPGGQSGLGTHYSQLASTGNVTLGGTLAIDTLSAPSVNDLDTVVGGNGSRTGTFATVTGAFSPGWAFGYKPTYGSNYVALEVGAPLVVKKSGPGSGTVTSSPSGINCGGQCDAPFFQDQKVTLTAHPANGSGFNGWSGACTGSATTCQVTMSQARTVTAAFAHATTISLSSSRNPAKKGKKVTYTATVSPHSGGGTVRFTSGGKTISGCGAVAVSASTGKATCSVTYHSTGKRKIQAIYSGTSSFARSASSTLTETIKK